jgi:hypothetical protein
VSGKCENPFIIINNISQSLITVKGCFYRALSLSKNTNRNDGEERRGIEGKHFCSQATYAQAALANVWSKLVNFPELDQEGRERSWQKDRTFLPCSSGSENLRIFWNAKTNRYQR